MLEVDRTSNTTPLNRIQQTGLFISVAFAFVVLFLHFPFSGYTTDHYVIVRFASAPCPPSPGLDAIKKMNMEQARIYSETMRECSNQEELQSLPITQWRSNDPVVWWFGSVIHTAVTFLFVLFLGGISLWAFRTRKNST